MSINNQIDILIENNKKLKPVNMTTFNNPFLMLSETTALNNLVSNTRPSTRAKKEGIERPINEINIPYDSHTLGDGSIIYEPSKTDEQNLARHVMNEVYASEDNRRDIEGYTMLKSLGDDRNIFYKSKKDNIILYGIRGTEKTSGMDWLTDAEIAMSLYTDNVSNETMTERYGIANEKYNQIRLLYPKSKIIMAGHSLGNSVGLDVLYKNQEDSNLALYGYNGYLHPRYTGNNDPRYNPQRTAYDIVSYWDKNARKVKRGDITPEIVGAGTTIAGITAVTARTIRDMVKGGAAAVKLYNDFAQDIIDGRGAGTKEWGVLWDTNRAKQLELESKPQNAETISEMENLIAEKQELNLDLVDSIPEIGGDEHIKQVVESKISPSESLRDLGFVGDSLEPEITQEMLNEQAELYSDIASQKSAATLLEIAKKKGVRATGLATLILGSSAAGIGIAHATENFPPEKNLFINKKKEKEIDDDEIYVIRK